MYIFKNLILNKYANNLWESLFNKLFKENWISRYRRIEVYSYFFLPLRNSTKKCINKFNVRPENLKLLY